MNMKKTLLTIMLAAAFANAVAQDNPRMTSMDLSASELAHYMAPGWNLGNTLEGGSSANVFTNDGGVDAETSWQGTKTTQQLLTLIKEKGFNSIRIPTAWVMGHLTDKATMAIDAAWMARVKEIVDYAISANLIVIINDHWDGGWLEHDGFTTGANVEEMKEQLRLLWTNIADEFKDYDERLIFAGLNEPMVGGASPNAIGTTLSDNDAFVSRLIDYEQTFIDAVRATGGNNAKRVLVVQGPKTEIALSNSSFDITRLSDTATGRLMFEIHHYDPYQFCLMAEDADWGINYDQLQFYVEGYTPTLYDETSYREVTTSVLNDIKNNFQALKTNFVDKGYPVIVGEYGANHKNSPYSDVTFEQASHDNSIQYWYNICTQYAYEAGCVPFAWDVNNTSYPRMTIFDRSTNAVLDTSIYDGIMQGDTNARTAFNAIYPEPSQTSGIDNAASFSDGAATPVYDISGRKVGDVSETLSQSVLAPGIYIHNGQKIFVR